MARKRTRRMPLYELMKPSGRAATEAPTAPAGPPDHGGDETGPGWLSPGRAVSLPVGYLFLAGAAVVALVAVAYSVGHDRGEKASEQLYADHVASQFSQIDDGQRPTDPLVEEPGGGWPGAGTPPVSGGLAREPAADMRPWGPILPDVDPREPGKHYFVLVHTLEAGAVRLATFCREEGIEAYVVSYSDNPRFRRVIVLPGFESGALSQQGARELRQRILRIGAKWKQNHRGESDLKDAFPSLYEG